MRKFSTKRMILDALMLALLIVLAQLIVPTPFGVPIGLQNFGVMLIGAFLKKKDALLVTLAYLALGIIGLPVFAGGTAGFARLINIRGGYLLSFPIAAFLISLFIEKTKKIVKSKTTTFLMISLVNIIFGVCFVDFGPGALGMHLFGKMPLILAEKCQFTFIIFDITKAIFTAVIFSAVPIQLFQNQSVEKI